MFFYLLRNISILFRNVLGWPYMIINQLRLWYLSYASISDPKKSSIVDQRHRWWTRGVAPKPPPKIIATIISTRNWRSWTSTRTNGMPGPPVPFRGLCRPTIRIPWAIVAGTMCTKSTRERSRLALNMSSPCPAMIWGMWTASTVNCCWIRGQDPIAIRKKNLSIKMW